MNLRIESLEKMLDTPRDGPLLRFSLGNEYLRAGATEKAAAAFRAALDKNPGYSAAWKALGKALAENGDEDGALAAYEEGIGVAQARGDIQAAREMTVFAKRLRKNREA